jgi:hypothetical protein
MPRVGDRPLSYHEHARRSADPAGAGPHPGDDEPKERIAKCRVERLTHAMGPAGIRRGKILRHDARQPEVSCPLGMVNDEFRVSRLNELRLVPMPPPWRASAFAECLR